ncbi:MAG: hypothetical protein HY011_16535 [Acidobacteria bacterium]|nr:hypothetical protein [Acidobacteriota bacterium]
MKTVTCLWQTCLGIVLALGCLNGHAVQAQTPSAALTNASQTKSKTAVSAQEVARLTGVASLLERYQQLPEAARQPGNGLSLEALALRQQITETVLSATLEADGVVAEIDSELEKIAEVSNYLAAQRDRRLLLNGIANAVSGGATGIIGTALQFNERTANLGNALGISGGAASLLLSLIGIRQAAGSKLALRDAPNMLAQIFDRPNEFHAGYPENFWRYLNAPVPTQPELGTRRERLLRAWQQGDLLPAPASRQRAAKIELLTSRNSEQRRVTLALLNDRALMLAGVRVWAELMKRDLWKLMVTVRTL